MAAIGLYLIFPLNQLSSRSAYITVGTLLCIVIFHFCCERRGSSDFVLLIDGRCLAVLAASSPAHEEDFRRPGLAGTLLSLNVGKLCASFCQFEVACVLNNGSFIEGVLIAVVVSPFDAVDDGCFCVISPVLHILGSDLHLAVVGPLNEKNFRLSAISWSSL